MTHGYKKKICNSIDPMLGSLPNKPLENLLHGLWACNLAQTPMIIKKKEKRKEEDQNVGRRKKLTLLLTNIINHEEAIRASTSGVIEVGFSIGKPRAWSCSSK